jgi:hypothetical protein
LPSSTHAATTTKKYDEKAVLIILLFGLLCGSGPFLTHPAIMVFYREGEKKDGHGGVAIPAPVLAAPAVLPVVATWTTSELMDPKGATDHKVEAGHNDSAEIIPGLWLGDQDSARDAPKKTMMRRVLSCLDDVKEHEAGDYEAEKARRDFDFKVMVGFHDGQNGTTVGFREEGAKYLEECFVHGALPVLVHCSVGKSRSTSVVLAYLMSRHGLSLREALSLVRASRPRAHPIKKFWLELVEHEAELNEPLGRALSLTVRWGGSGLWLSSLNKFLFNQSGFDKILQNGGSLK